ncbi:hypothetical protein HHI36_023649 [Cryptolaemus montrouzieri]|uniref:Uncharacterized protein n=1 Tax=Cryptolaemus montrouzieri TaxID=559131 RepID=A0ABD2PHW8_9CUCU
MTTIIDVVNNDESESTPEMVITGESDRTTYDNNLSKLTITDAKTFSIVIDNATPIDKIETTGTSDNSQNYAINIVNNDWGGATEEIIINIHNLLLLVSQIGQHITTT